MMLMISSNRSERRSEYENCHKYKLINFWSVQKILIALYIVIGDKDLLVIKEYENIQIVTAKDFCEKYLFG